MTVAPPHTVQVSTGLPVPEGGIESENGSSWGKCEMVTVCVRMTRYDQENNLSQPVDVSAFFG